MIQQVSTCFASGHTVGKNEAFIKRKLQRQIVRPCFSHHCGPNITQPVWVSSVIWKSRIRRSSQKQSHSVVTIHTHCGCYSYLNRLDELWSSYSLAHYCCTVLFLASSFCNLRPKAHQANIFSGCKLTKNQPDFPYICTQGK